LKFELKALEQLINVAVNPAKLTRQQLTKESFIEWKWLLKTEIEKLGDALDAAGISEAGSKCVERYFRKHQIILTELSDKAFHYQQQLGIENSNSILEDSSIDQLYNDTVETLEQLLEYVEKIFPTYFDTTLKITDAKKKSLEPAISLGLKSLEKELRQIEVAEDLITIACTPFREFCTKEKFISYRDVSYLQVYRKELTYFIANVNSANVTELFCELLLQLNFNDLRFYNYLVIAIKEKAKTCQTLPEQLENLHHRLKLLNQLPVKAGLTFRHEMPTIKEQVRTWISEELLYLNKQKELMIIADGSEDEQPNDEKIQTTLSVADLSLGVKLLLESKMINNKNPSELIRLVARNFKTDRNDVISENSIRNKYYTVESGSLISMREVLTGLIKLVRQYEG
jgi:hypothetical protein